MNTNIKKKIFILVLILLIVGSVLVTYFKMVVYKNYQITAEVSCEPGVGECFTRETDEGDIEYYKVISKKASTIDICQNTEEKIGCGEELQCVENEEECFYEYCSDDTMLVEDGACL